VQGACTLKVGDGWFDSSAQSQRSVLAIQLFNSEGIEMKFCKDCKWQKPVSINDKDFSECICPDLASIDPVTGGQEFRWKYCSTQRYGNSVFNKMFLIKCFLLSSVGNKRFILNQSKPIR
jgi:hypothetical protein